MIFVLISSVVALMQPDLSKLCHTSGRKKKCLSALSVFVLFLFFFSFNLLGMMTSVRVPDLFWQIWLLVPID